MKLVHDGTRRISDDDPAHVELLNHGGLLPATGSASGRHSGQVGKLLLIQDVLVLSRSVVNQRCARRNSTALVVPVVGAPEGRGSVRATVALLYIVDSPVDLRLPVAERDSTMP